MSLSSSTALLKLPPEIFLSIFQSLLPPDLCAVCLACRTLRSLAEPSLYSRIHWTWMDTRSPPIILLLRSILSRPQLAAHIRALVLDGDNFGRTRDGGQPPTVPVTTAELDKPIAFIKKFNVPYEDLWIQKLQWGEMDAFIALLLSQLSNLRYLHLDCNFAKVSRIVGMVLRSALCEPVDRGLSTFQRLRDISFSIRSGLFRKDEVYTMADVLPFFYLSTVRSISASIGNPVAFAWPAQHAPTCSALTSLDLTSIRESHLRHILSCTTGLKKLRWEWFYRGDLRDRFLSPIIDLDRIVEAISPVRRTLTELTITAWCAMVRAEGPLLTIKGSMAAIVNFESLKRVEVPQPFLMGFSPSTGYPLDHVIPRNIESLIITDDLTANKGNELHDLTVLLRIRSWLESWRATTPHLGSLSLSLKITKDEWDSMMRSELRQLAIEAGVSVKITKLLRE